MYAVLFGSLRAACSALSPHDSVVPQSRIRTGPNKPNKTRRSLVAKARTLLLYVCLHPFKRSDAMQNARDAIVVLTRGPKAPHPDSEL